MPGSTAPRPSLRIKLDPGYGLLTLAYLGGIYCLFALPGLGARAGESGVQAAVNVFHIPLYAGLAFCFLQAVSGRQEVSWSLSGLTPLGTGAYAAIDEWHQVFVPGRYASLADFLMDIVGILGLLLILRWLSAVCAQGRQQLRARH